MIKWATAPMERDQMLMFNPTLDQMIPEDHPVRLFEEILDLMDWSCWEQRYVLVFGRPPIHPKVVASVLLYGLCQGIRASRRLEWACGNAIDFMWLAQGRKIDHSSFCQFRTDFAKELKDLFRQVGRVAMGMGMVRLNQVALDGTKIKANSSRQGTASAATIERRLAALDVQIERMLQEAGRADHRDAELFGESVSPNRLPRELANVKRRQQRLAKALDKARQVQANKGVGGEGQVKEVKVAVADPDASICPNKEGGFAPNYTPVVTVDTTSGIIVAADVLDNSDESEAVVPAVEQIQENLGGKPEVLLADSAFNSGPNLEYLQEHQVEAYIPSATRQDSPDNPARREALNQPAPAHQWGKLPLDRSTGRLGRTSFVYDSWRDCYWCPMGKALGFDRMVEKRRRKWTIEYRRYVCRQCDGCALRDRCLTKKARRRMIDRDRHEHLREAMDARLHSPEGRRTYRQRAPSVEGMIGLAKSALGLRQFLLRGLAKVRTEWRWVCAALNLRKMAATLATLRAASVGKAQVQAAIA